MTLRTEAEIEPWMTAPTEEALKLQRPLPDGALKVVAAGLKEDPPEFSTLQLSKTPQRGHVVKRKPVSIEIVHDEKTSFVVSVYADGEVVREPVVKRKATRKPFRPQRRLTMDRSRKKRF